jgi:hypothetical protein
MSYPGATIVRMVRGRILAESLRVGSELRLPDLRVTAIVRQDVSAGAASFQPDVWTLLDIEGPDDIADELGRALAGALTAGQGWYADFRVGDDHVVVFPGRVFRYTVGDSAGRAEAVDHGRADGVPAHQLDWGP